MPPVVEQKRFKHAVGFCKLVCRDNCYFLGRHRRLLAKKLVREMHVDKGMVLFQRVISALLLSVRDDVRRIPLALRPSAFRPSPPLSLHFPYSIRINANFTFYLRSSTARSTYFPFAFPPPSDLFPYPGPSGKFPRPKVRF
jgi:hypothetical protein